MPDIDSPNSKLAPSMVRPSPLSSRVPASQQHENSLIIDKFEWSHHHYHHHRHKNPSYLLTRRVVTLVIRSRRTSTPTIRLEGTNDNDYNTGKNCDGILLFG